MTTLNISDETFLRGGGLCCFHGDALTRTPHGGLCPAPAGPIKCNGMWGRGRGGVRNTKTQVNDVLVSRDSRNQDLSQSHTWPLISPPFPALPHCLFIDKGTRLRTARFRRLNYSIICNNSELTRLLTRCNEHKFCSSQINQCADRERFLASLIAAMLIDASFAWEIRRPRLRYY